MQKDYAEGQQPAIRDAGESNLVLVAQQAFSRGVREGTIIAAAVTGKIIALMKKPLSPIVQKLCFGTESTVGKAG